MKLNQVTVRIITANAADALEVAVNAFLLSGLEKNLLDIQYQVDGGVYSALVQYTA